MLAGKRARGGGRDSLCGRTGSRVDQFTLDECSRERAVALGDRRVPIALSGQRIGFRIEWGGMYCANKKSMVPCCRKGAAKNGDLSSGIGLKGLV